MHLSKQSEAGRVPFCTKLLAPAGAALLTLCTLGVPPASAAGFPDAWFFPNRPAGLIELEGKKPPALQLDSWIGDQVDITEAKGKVVVIDFWATWCGPCMAAIPENVNIYSKYKDRGLVILGVHDANSGWDKAPDVVRDKKINYSVAVDKKGGLSAKAFHLGFWPTYVLIDRQGLIRGAGLNPQFLETAVKQLLAEGGAATGGGAAPKWPPADWFYGGDRRPAKLKGLEGKPMPKLSVAQWLGKELTAAEYADRVVVLHFLAAGNVPSMKQAEALAKLDREMGAQGVLVLAVCAPGDAWDELQKIAGKGKLPKRLCQDAKAENARPSAPAGGSAAAFGIRYLPCTIVIDRAGVVRGAGVRVERVKEFAGKLLAENSKPPAGAAAKEKTE